MDGPQPVSAFKSMLAGSAGIDGLRLWLEALGRVAVDQLAAEWSASGLHALWLSRPRPDGLAAAPRDPRPADEARGRAVLEGRFVFAGVTLDVGPGGDPWNRPSPSRAFAERLHAMSWLRDLTAPAAGEGAARTALSLVLCWRPVFGRWSPFAWSPPILERRVFALACALKAMSAEASDLEADLLLAMIAAQARHLLLVRGDPARAAERAAAAAVAGCALAGRAGEDLRRRATARLEAALPQTVLPDGGHATRSPQAGLELLLDLITLDDAMAQLGQPASSALSGAIDRLGAALRFFTMSDGRLAALQGGGLGEPRRIAAALAHHEPLSPPASAPHARYDRLTGGRLQVMVDAGPAATGDLSLAARAHPLAIEVLAGRDRLFVNGQPPTEAGIDERRTPAASTATLGEETAGRLLAGLRARGLGPRLVLGATQVGRQRNDTEQGAWLDLWHDGWLSRFGLIHDRRLFLGAADDELRGEDALRPGESGLLRALPHGELFLTVRFQLHSEVRAQAALDNRSVLLLAPTSGGWRLRSDAPETRISPALGGASQVVMRTLLRRDHTARIRWKLTPADAD